MRVWRRGRVRSTSGSGINGAVIGTRLYGVVRAEPGVRSGDGAIPFFPRTLRAQTLGRARKAERREQVGVEGRDLGFTKASSTRSTSSTSARNSASPGRRR